MALVPTAVYEKCILLGIDVFNGKVSAKDAVAVATEYGSNPTSAKDTIEVIPCMAEGRRYLRGLSAPGTDFALSALREQMQNTLFENALKALEGHIKHDEDRLSTKRHALRIVLAKYEALREAFPDIGTLIAKEAAELAAARALSPDERQKLLPRPGHKPRQVTATTQTFVRNQIVVTEVLDRAKGHCGHCKAKAPFERRKDGTPYLEVHHKIHLMDDGDDTVENAIALCPNCHREAHYGLEREKFRQSPPPQLQLLH